MALLASTNLPVRIWPMPGRSEAVRTSASPDDEIAAFVASTYEQAATRAQWDRTALEAPPPAVR